MAATQLPPQPRVDAEADQVPLAADTSVFTPYVPDETDLVELTPGGVLLGMVLGLVFAASSV